MSCVRCAVGVDGVVAVAVVGNDDDLVVVPEGSFYRLVHADVDSRDSLLDGVIYAGVTDHIAVGVVQDDAVVLLTIQRITQGDGHLRCGHHRLQVVCGYLRTGDEYAVLVLELCLAAAGEEERHVCELLGLGYTQLLHAGFRNDLA